MDLNSIVAKLESVGWEAETSSSVTDEENLETLTHELAHNFILGDTRPKSMADTDRLVCERTPGHLGDADEILATAVTIQLLEQHYGIIGATVEDSLLSVSMNVKGRAYCEIKYLALDPQRNAANEVIELLGTDRVNNLVSQIQAYIVSL